MVMTSGVACSINLTVPVTLPHQIEALKVLNGVRFGEGCPHSRLLVMELREFPQRSPSRKRLLVHFGGHGKFSLHTDALSLSNSVSCHTWG